ncbi:MAG: radical SAM protein [Deltaproteobacteria bacterium]|nr:radical SAM protein [Deltaproteobacteria bacterium]
MNPGAPSLDVALVGREQPGDENLALRYLAAALAEAGHRAHIVPLLGPGHLETAVRTVHELRVPVVGVSIPDTDVAIDGFAFVRLLRRRGHVGHVTCGGPLATLIRKEILARQPGFDSVVRQEGEVPIVALADRLAQGRAWTDVPGITVREGDGPPAPVADLTPLRLRPFRPLRLPRILGVPVARMLASRGCPGRCAYCGPAALQREAVAEGLRAGIDAPTLARRGVGGTRRRAPGDVADEVAALHHERNARFFVLLDDNLLGGDPPRAAAWLRELHAELDRRRVGRTAWSMQLEAASVTDEVLRAVVGLGAVRVLVGVEALTDDGLRALGRPGSAAAGLEVVRRLRTSGAVANFNVLLVHPQATAASLRAEIEALASVPELHSDALSLAVNSGTELWRRL